MNRLRAYLQLMRFPAVFSVIADVMMAYFITQPDGELELNRLLLMLTVSCSFYLAGMVFNDIFDRKIDVIERPGRPIPSGRIFLSSAVLLGSSLLLIGLLIVASFGMFRLQLGLLLVLCILLYDGVFNKTLAGPLFMGGCRMINLLMVASAHSDVANWGELWTTPLRETVIAIGFYITGLTWFAQYESLHQEQLNKLKGRLLPLLVPIFVIYTGLAGVAVVGYWQSRLTSLYSLLALMGYGVILGVIGSHLRNAIIAPSNELIQQAVKTMLQSIVMIDAVVILLLTGQLGLAVITLALVIPARLLSKWGYIT